MRCGSRRGFGVVGLAITIFVLAVIGSGLWYYIHKNSPFSQNRGEAPIAVSFDWKKEFGDIDWQSAEQNCRRGLDPPCGGDDSLQKLYDFIARVATKAAPQGYVLGDPHNPDLPPSEEVGVPADVWVDDLNGDGAMDMVMIFIPASLALNSHGMRDASNDILMIVTPTSLDGTSKVLARFTQKEYEALGLNDFDEALPPGLRQIEGTLDFKHDGRKELVGQVNHGGSVWSSEDMAYVYSVDYTKGAITTLQTRDASGTIESLSVGKFSEVTFGDGKIPDPVGREDGYDHFFKDVDHDGIDEYIQINTATRYPDENTTLLTGAMVFKWNGTLFDYSQTLSNQVASSSDSLKYLPSDDFPYNLR